MWLHRGEGGGSCIQTLSMIPCKIHYKWIALKNEGKQLSYKTPIKNINYKVAKKIIWNLRLSNHFFPYKLL